MIVIKLTTAILVVDAIVNYYELNSMVNLVVYIYIDINVMLEFSTTTWNNIYC